MNAQQMKLLESVGEGILQVAAREEKKLDQQLKEMENLGFTCIYGKDDWYITNFHYNFTKMKMILKHWGRGEEWIFKSKCDKNKIGDSLDMECEGISNKHN